MWHKIIQAYSKTVDHGQVSLNKTATSKKEKHKRPTQNWFIFSYLDFNSSEKELNESIKDLQLQAWTVLRKKIDEELADAMLLLKLRSSFEEKFRYDDKGLPRVWKPEDDIDSFFKKARDDVST